nr:MAG TPA: hypothetical protein [Caudoviricetes sp.]
MLCPFLIQNTECIKKKVGTTRGGGHMRGGEGAGFAPKKLKNNFAFRYEEQW